MLGNASPGYRHRIRQTVDGRAAAGLFDFGRGTRDMAGADTDGRAFQSVGQRRDRSAIGGPHAVQQNDGLAIEQLEKFPLQ